MHESHAPLDAPKPSPLAWQAWLEVHELLYRAWFHTAHGTPEWYVMGAAYCYAHERYREARWGVSSA